MQKERVEQFLCRGTTPRGTPLAKIVIYAIIILPIGNNNVFGGIYENFKK